MVGEQGCHPKGIATDAGCHLRRNEGQLGEGHPVNQPWHLPGELWVMVGSWREKGENGCGAPRAQNVCMALPPYSEALSDLGQDETWV